MEDGEKVCSVVGSECGGASGQQQCQVQRHTNVTLAQFSQYYLST